MAVSDLTNTKWLLNNRIFLAGYTEYNILFTSNNYDFYQLILDDDDEGENNLYYRSHTLIGPTYMVRASSSDGTMNENYKTIEITGGTDATNATLITWLSNNATQVITNVDIVLGSNTLTGVDTIKVVDANNTSAYVDFVYGNTPSTTTSIKIGDSTLTGVNTISVLGTDSNQKTFGYKPNGFSISYSLSGDMGGGTTPYFEYNNLKYGLNPSDNKYYNAGVEVAASTLVNPIIGTLICPMGTVINYTYPDSYYELSSTGDVVVTISSSPKGGTITVNGEGSFVLKGAD